MSALDNPKNIIGIGNILIDDNELNIEELEKSILTGSQFVKKDNVDLAKEYTKEIDDLSKKFGLNKPNDDNDSKDDTADWSPNFMARETTPRRDTSDFDTDSMFISQNQSSGQTHNQPPVEKKAIWSSFRPEDEQLNRMTNEERKQEHVNKVLGSMDKVNDDAEFIQQEDNEDEMAKILEQIDLLKSNLESEGVDLSRIQDVNSSTSAKEAKSILRILQIKNDRLRYCDFFEEGILALAYGLEGVFNGNREIFGSKIDLTGYSDTVKVKLKRMRYDTSNFVSGIMQGYNISSGWRIALELIPSLFLYSRDRKLTAKDNLISDESYKKAMQDLQK